MKTPLLAALLFLSVPAVAESTGVFQALVNKVEKFTKGEKGCKFCISTRDPEEAPEWEKCLSSLCPIRPLSNQDVSKSRRELSEKDPKFIEVNRLIHKMVHGEVQDMAAQQRALLAALETSQKITEPKAIALYNLTHMFAKIPQLNIRRGGKVDAQHLYNLNVATGGNEENLNQLKFLADKAQKVFDEQDPIVELELRDFQKKHSPAQLKKILISTYNETVRLANGASRQFGIHRKFFLPAGDETETLRQIKAGTLTESRWNDLSNLKMNLHILTKAIADPKAVKVFSRKELSIREALPPDAEKNLRSQIETAKILADRNTDFAKSPYGETISDIYSKCATALTEGYAMSPTQKQIDQLVKNEPKVREHFLKRTAELLSPHSSRILRKESSKWRFKLPPNQDQFTEVFKDQLNSQISTQTSEGEFENADEKTRQLLLAQVVGQGEIHDPSTTLSHIHDLCTDQVPSAAQDLANTARNEILFSATSATRPEIVRTILIHEYSHLMSGVIREHKDMSKETKAWFKDFRECLVEQRHGKFPFAEEDFAQIMVPRLDPDSIDYVCSGWAGESSVHLNDNSWDKQHSGAVYSLVLGSTMRPEGIPQSCRNIFAKQGEKVLPENCFAKVKGAAVSAK